MRSTETLLFAITLLMMTLVTWRDTSTYGFSTGSSWEVRNVPVSLASVRDAWRQTAVDSLVAWNRTDSDFAFFREDTSANRVYTVNRSDVPWLAQSPCYDSDGNVSNLPGTVGRNARCEVQINTAYDYSTSGEAGLYDLSTLLKHELGHWLTLHHSTDSEAIMRQGQPTGAVWEITLDDLRGIRALYGPAVNAEGTITPDGPVVQKDFSRDVGTEHLWHYSRIADATYLLVVRNDERADALRAVIRRGGVRVADDAAVRSLAPVDAPRTHWVLYHVPGTEQSAVRYNAGFQLLGVNPGLVFGGRAWIEMSTALALSNGSAVSDTLGPYPQRAARAYFWGWMEAGQPYRIVLQDTSTTSGLTLYVAGLGNTPVNSQSATGSTVYSVSSQLDTTFVPPRGDTYFFIVDGRLIRLVRFVSIWKMCQSALLITSNMAATK